MDPATQVTVVIRLPSSENRCAVRTTSPDRDCRWTDQSAGEAVGRACGVLAETVPDAVRLVTPPTETRLDEQLIRGIEQLLRWHATRLDATYEQTTLAESQ